MQRATPRLAAAEKVFGDLDALDRDLDSYEKQRRLRIFVVQPGAIRVGVIAVKTLSVGHAEMLPTIMASKRGVDDEQAKALVTAARTIAAKHHDPAVLAALAEAEFDAGNRPEAIAAADRAIALDPAAKNAFVQKGLALFATVEDADDRDAAYLTAMRPFQALNRLENDHPYPLIYFYRSFTERGKDPPETARHALERAADLAPFDQGLAWEAGQMLAQEGSVAASIGRLSPLAANPHGGGLARLAQAMITFLGDKPEGVRVDLSNFAGPVPEIQATSEEPAAQ